jgi:hypothetical protein
MIVLCIACSTGAVDESLFDSDRGSFLFYDRAGAARRHLLVRPDGMQGRTAMRICFSSWATPDEDVDRDVAAIVRAARDYRPAHKNGVVTKP